MITDSPFDNIEACVFDAYGTLLDVNSAAAGLSGELGELEKPLSDMWRTKQLQYTWLSSLMGKHRDFRSLTRSALDFAMQALDIENDDLKEKLLRQYEILDAYPEVPAILSALRSGGLKTAILSNGTPDMLDNAVTTAGIKSDLDHVLSIESVGVYKPDPRVYQLAVDTLETPIPRICFLSSNGWDATGAAAFGFQVGWVNRNGQPEEQLGFSPVAILNDLSGLPDLIGTRSD